MLCGQCRGRKLVLPHGGGCLKPVPFDEPGRVVELPKNEQRLTELLDGVEGAHPEQVLFECAEKALGAAIPLGGPHEGGRTRDAQEGELLLEGVGHVLAPVIVPDGETARDLFGESPEAATDALPDRLPRPQTAGPTGGGGPAGAARAPRSGWPDGRRGCPRTRLSSDRWPQTPRPAPRP